MLTFKEIHSIFSSGPHVHMSIHSIIGKPMPAGLQRDRVTITGSVVPVLVQPVPAISHEVGVEADQHLPVRRLLLSDPVKHSVEAALTASWSQTQTSEEAVLLHTTRWCCNHVP